MAGREQYYGAPYSNMNNKPLPSAPAESVYSERAPFDYLGAHQHGSPVPVPSANPFSATPPPPSYQSPPALGPRKSSDPFQSSDDIPLQSHQPKRDKESSRSPPRGFSRQDSESYLILQEPPQKQKPTRGRFDWSRIPWVCYTVTIIQVCVFIAELVKSSSLTGSPIASPSLNPMLGPPNTLLINMGARYVACMRNQVGIQDVAGAKSFPCPNSTDASTAQATCTLRDLCGFESSYPVPLGNPDPNQSGPAALNDQPPPNQWFRFIIPIFLHGGFIHIASNLLLQLMIARDMEKVIGSIRFALVYFSAGIFGFVFGGNYAASGIASTGCSGSLFGIIGLVFLDLFYTWGDRDSPWFDLILLAFTVIIEIVVGLLPTGLDNFSHIGGLIVGLVLGLCLIHSPNALRKHIGTAPLPYHGGGLRGAGANKQERRKSQPIGSTMVVYGTTGTDATGFRKDPKNFFKDRKPLWWIWWLFRVAALLTIVISFIVLIKNFYANHDSNCSWCKYMSCINHNNWCQRYDLSHTTSSPAPTSSGPARMML